MQLEKEDESLALDETNFQSLINDQFENNEPIQISLFLKPLDQYVEQNLIASAEYFARNVFHKNEGSEIQNSDLLTNKFPELLVYDKHRKCKTLGELTLIFEKEKLDINLKYCNPYQVEFPDEQFPYGAFVCLNCEEERQKTFKCYTFLFNRQPIERESKHKPCLGNLRTNEVEFSQRKSFFLQKTQEFLNSQVNFGEYLGNECLNYQFLISHSSGAMKNDHLLRLMYKRTLDDAFSQVFKQPCNEQRKVPEQLLNWSNIMKIKFGSNSLRAIRGAGYEQEEQGVKEISVKRKLFPDNFYENVNVSVPVISTLQKKISGRQSPVFERGEY